MINSNSIIDFKMMVQKATAYLRLKEIALNATFKSLNIMSKNKK